MSTLMFWNKQNNNNSNSNGNNTQNNDGKNGKRTWLHGPDALMNGHVVYLVKFFGNAPVDQPKGIEVVKDAIRKLQFAHEMKKAENGTQEKFKKVEITISVDGVAIQEPRTQKILHQFPLYNISYCADEKGVKKFFSFIAKNTPNATQTKTPSSNGFHKGDEPAEEKHECFVFISSKLASDITLTIGQAFDLAYKKYVNSTGNATIKDQPQIKELEKTISIYKQRLTELSNVVSKSELDRMLSRLGIKDILEVPSECSNPVASINSSNSNSTTNESESVNLIETSNNNNSNNKPTLPVVPPRNLHNQITDVFKTSDNKMGELLLNSDSDSDFDPRAEEHDSSNGSNGSNGGTKANNDLFGFEPPKSYGQQLFTNNNDKLNNNNFLGTEFNGSILNTSPPPLLAPPPKAGPRRTAPVTPNGHQDLFGSTPFSAPNVFDSSMKSKIVDDFSLESLDPLRN